MKALSKIERFGALDGDNNRCSAMLSWGAEPGGQAKSKINVCDIQLRAVSLMWGRLNNFGFSGGAKGCLGSCAVKLV